MAASRARRERRARERLDRLERALDAQMYAISVAEVSLQWEQADRLREYADVLRSQLIAAETQLHSDARLALVS